MSATETFALTLPAARPHRRGARRRDRVPGGAAQWRARGGRLRRAGNLRLVHGAGPRRQDASSGAGRGTSGAAQVREKKWARACQLQPRSDCTIEVAERSLAPVARTEVDAAGAEVLPTDAAVTGIDVAVPEATLTDTASDFDRVMRGLGAAGLSADLAAARQLPDVLRKHDWNVRMLLRGREVIGFAPPKSRLLGLAVDFGTTNAAGFLIDLETGARLASLGIENPQTAWGADLISRINYAIQVPGGAAELQASGIAALNALAHDLCQAIGASAGGHRRCRALRQHRHAPPAAWPAGAPARPRALRGRDAGRDGREGARSGRGGCARRLCACGAQCRRLRRRRPRHGAARHARAAGRLRRPASSWTSAPTPKSR